jgi:hypothetical protein
VARGGNSICVCGHAVAAHEHYRRGTDCALCSGRECPQFRNAAGLIGWLRRKVTQGGGKQHYSAVKLHLVRAGR